MGASVGNSKTSLLMSSMDFDVPLITNRLLYSSFTDI